MQKLLFVSVSHGTSKKGNDYDMTTVSDGLSSFVLTNAPGIREEIQNMELSEGEAFEAEVHVKAKYGNLQGTIVAVTQ